MHNIAQVVVGSLPDGEIDNKTKIAQSKQWLEETLEMAKVNQDDLPAMPMRQQEVKQCLIAKQTQDEAEATKFLAGEPGVNSVVARIYTTWGLDGQIIKECQLALIGDRNIR